MRFTALSRCFRFPRRSPAWWPLVVLLTLGVGGAWAQAPEASRLPAVPMPPVMAAMTPDPEVDDGRTAVIAQVNTDCTHSTAMDTPEKVVLCRLRTVAPRAVGVGFTLAEARMASLEHRMTMSDDQLKAATDRVQAAQDLNQVGTVMNQVWSQHATDCQSLEPGEPTFACEQKAQFNAGLTMGVAMYMIGNTAHLFDDLKPRPGVFPHRPPASSPVVTKSGHLSTRRPPAAPSAP